jgi:hypothetical protein
MSRKVNRRKKPRKMPYVNLPGIYMSKMDLPGAQRIRAWFHNHMRGSISGNGARGLLKTKTKQKTLQEWQVYHAMTYKSQWKAVIDEAWEKYKTACEEAAPGDEPEETRFGFMASFMRQRYLEETEEVQNNVRKRREELKTEIEDDEEGEEKNFTYQKYLELHHPLLNDNSPSCSAIDRLPRTLAVWGDSIQKQTGWNITFLAGGPAPSQNGKIMSFM